MTTQAALDRQRDEAQAELDTAREELEVAEALGKGLSVLSVAVITPALISLGAGLLLRPSGLQVTLLVLGILLSLTGLAIFALTVFYRFAGPAAERARFDTATRRFDEASARAVFGPGGLR